MLELSTMRALHTVSICGSISSAAEALHLTTSAVSQRLSKLEREVGQPLLERYGRGVRLTDAAKLLVERADMILSLVERAEAELESHRGSVVGKLRLAAFPSAARGLLTTTLCELRTDFPEVDLELAELEPDVAIPLIMRGDIDVAIVNDWFNVPLTLPDGMRRADLLDDIADIALPASHPLAARESVDLAELTGETWVSWMPGTVCHDWLVFTLRGHGVEPRIAHTAGEYPTQLALVAAGFGVAVLPRLGRDDLPAGVRVVSIRPVMRRQVYAVWRVESDRRPAIRAAVRAMVSTARRHQVVSTSLPVERPLSNSVCAALAPASG
jgi:DNA-binding transcriptional LysR family regulator